MVAYEVSSEFIDRKDYLLSIPSSFAQSGLVIRNDRNVIKRITTDQGDFVVKYFSGMYFINRLMYSLFRKSKAERSYLYSKLLNAKGIQTPAAVAWIDFYHWGLLKESYFINQFSPQKMYEQVLDHYRANDPHEKDVLLRALAAFVLHMHSLGFFHDDLSLGNVLVTKQDGAYQFSLLDLNRLKIGKVGFRAGLMNFAKLGLGEEDTNLIIRTYAELKGKSGDEAVSIFWSTKKLLSNVIDFRRAIRRHTLTPIERFFGLRK
jgi:serine/threonine protein kinase